jgi:hypothetical protein
MISKVKKRFWLLLVGSLFLLFTLNFGSCDALSEGAPFSFNEISSQIMVTAPVNNSTYSESDIMVNVSLHIGGHEYEPNTYYVPYQNISCVYSLDDSEWQNMTLVSAVKSEQFPSIPNKFWYSNIWVNYTATLHDVSEGPHYLKVDVKPDSIRTRDISSSQDEPIVYFNVISRPSTQLEDDLPINSAPIIGLVIGVIFTSGFIIYVKKGKSSTKP